MLQPNLLVVTVYKKYIDSNSVPPSICLNHNYISDDLKKAAGEANLDQINKEKLLYLLESYHDLFSVSG